MALRLTIGDFSRMTHLSVKALRHYHEIGLLAPVGIDASSGYRQYDVEQVPVAQVIKRLRDLGMGLDDIAQVLRAPDVAARNRAIVEHLQRMESQLEQTRATVMSLRRLLEMPDAPSPSKIEFRSIPATASVAIRERVAVSDLGGWWVQAFEELHSVVARRRLEIAGPDGALFSSAWFEDEIGDVVAFTPVGELPEPGRGQRVQPHLVPAAEAAVLLHEGSLTDLDRSFAALGGYVLERAIAVEGPIREYYLVTAFDTPDEARHRTEVAWPIFQTSTRP
ncbi:MAG TPA: MerR family transcriptional regulator [Candidatus Dormibacteraeota bacterium]|nr:MerR family transcriptional regulator [Candidatus Dormibacteraeota bacterium]